MLSSGSDIFVGGSDRTGSFCRGHYDFLILKIFQFECIYDVHEPMYMHLVTHRITYCLSGSGKINAFLS